nr:immunoglobulin heavy chain junction region [Mus musculus]
CARRRGYDYDGFAYW